MNIRARFLFFISFLFVVPSFAFAAIDTNVSFGAHGSTVVSMQQFLISQNLLSANNATGYFGTLTLAAVKKFQQAQGISPVSGYVGPLTRARVQALLTVAAPTPLQLDSAALVVSPIAGASPLMVSFSASLPATISGASAAYSTGTFSLDFGDNTSGAANQVCTSTSCTVTASHTYSFAGTYKPVLSWSASCKVAHGGDCTSVSYPIGSATVSVTGAAQTNAKLSPSLTSSHKLPVDVTFAVVGTGGPFQIDYGDNTTPNLLGYQSTNGQLTGIKRYTQSGTYTVRLMSNGVVLDTATLTLDDSLCATATQQLMHGQINGTAFAQACY